MIIRTNRTVRIRIVSGGMEHRTLDSLRSHFSIADLKDPLKDGRLVSWLESIGEKEMAEKVGSFNGNLENKEGVKEFCRLFDVPFDSDIFIEDFNMLCEDYQKAKDKSLEKWLAKFDKCREANKSNEQLCQKIDIQKAKVMIEQKANQGDIAKILLPLADKNKNARDLLKKQNPECFCENFDLLCEVYQTASDKSSDKWLRFFAKCRDKNAINEILCQKIDLQTVKIMQERQMSEKQIVNILLSLSKKNNQEARNLLKKYNPELFCSDFNMLCSMYQEATDKADDKWLLLFSKCKEQQSPYSSEIQLIDLQIAKMMVEHKKDSFEIFKTLTMMPDKSSQIYKILKQQLPSKLEFKVNGVSFNMILVEGNDTLSDFYMGETVVTEELWHTTKGYKNSSSLYPVTNISWIECNRFIDLLNQLTGNEFSLPTEEQWEFAAKGGNKSNNYKYSGSDYIAEVGWNRGKIHLVAELAPNELGLYDMSGNVKEWCEDEAWEWTWNRSYTKQYYIKKEGIRKLKGGGYNSYAENCEITSKESAKEKYSYSDIGFRLCLNI